MLNNATINDKLLIAAGVTLTCTVIIGVWSVFQFEKLYIETKNFDERLLSALYSVHEQQHILDEIHGTLSIVLLLHDTQTQAPAMTSNTEIRYVDSLIKHVQALRRDKKTDVLPARLSPSLTERSQDSAALMVYLLGCRQAINLAQKGAFTDAKHVYAQVIPVFQQTRALSNKRTAAVTQFTDAVATETLRHFLHSRLFVTVCLVGAILISLTVNWLIARSIVRRLRIIQIAAERICGGNLNVRIAMSEPDEIGRLARAFNRMSENLKDTLQNI